MVCVELYILSREKLYADAEMCFALVQRKLKV